MFEVGDIVKPKGGKKPCEVLWSSNGLIRYRYVSGVHESERPARFFEYYTEDLPEKEKEMAQEKLYEVNHDGVTKYAKYLATDSNGLWVMEGKSGEGVFSVDKSKVEEVVPHTVDVVFIGGNTTEYSYQYTKGKLTVGDVLLIGQSSSKTAGSSSAIVRVAKVDSKSKSATKELIVTAKFKVDTDL